jgi:16S rRNA (uracil1498-N3)-methyltransferase
VGAGRSKAAAQVFVADLGAPEPEPADAHHLVRVLRLSAGELVLAADGCGKVLPCRFTGHGTLLEPTGPVQTVPRPAPALVVAFAPAKGDRPDWAVQKLTELGVDRIVPLVADRGVVRWQGARQASALDRLRRIAREAAAQSRRAWLPEVGPLHTLGELTGEAGGQLALAERGGEPPSLDLPVVAVGPEGGWSERELGLGLPVVGLGDQVLRAETAAVAAGTLLGALRAGLVRSSRPSSCE